MKICADLDQERLALGQSTMRLASGESIRVELPAIIRVF